MKNPNELGIYDMSGNVGELTQGVYKWKTGGGSANVYRGGNYLSGPHHCNVYDRDPSSSGGSDKGLRLVMDVR
jgi:formylglycine-generating enzyme required for sulfatase activity